jgi:hypothetical protein
LSGCDCPFDHVDNPSMVFMFRRSHEDLSIQSSLEDRFVDFTVLFDDCARDFLSFCALDVFVVLQVSQGIFLAGLHGV